MERHSVNAEIVSISDDSTYAFNINQLLLNTRAVMIYHDLRRAVEENHVDVKMYFDCVSDCSCKFGFSVLFVS